jgi:hypothetical protein
MSDQFIKEQRVDLRQLNSLLRLAESGQISNFEAFEQTQIKDRFLKDKVSHIKGKAKEWYTKALEVEAFQEEFKERPAIGDDHRWNLSGDSSVPSWVVSHKWDNKEFFQQFVSKLLIREVEQREKNILGIASQVVGIGR